MYCCCCDNTIFQLNKFNFNQSSEIKLRGIMYLLAICVLNGIWKSFLFISYRNVVCIIYKNVFVPNTDSEWIQVRKSVYISFYFRQTGFLDPYWRQIYVIIYPQNPFLICLQSFSLLMFVRELSFQIFFSLSITSQFSYGEYIYLLKIIKCGKKGHFPGPVSWLQNRYCANIFLNIY